LNLYNNSRSIYWTNLNITSLHEVMTLKFVVGYHTFFRSVFSTHVNLPNFPHHTDCGSVSFGSVRWVPTREPSLDVIGNRFLNSEGIGKTSRKQGRVCLMVVGPFLLFSCGQKKRKEFAVSLEKVHLPFLIQLRYIQYVQLFCVS